MKRQDGMCGPGEPRGDELPAAAQRAWLAYQEMAASKQAYFSLLQELDRQDNGTPTIAEQLHLERLLKAHDEKVKLFSAAMAAVTEPAAREALLKRLSPASADL